jgi:hypothetical protein
MFFKRKNQNHITPQFLDTLIKGLNYVANCASDMALSHYQNLISQYFDRLEDGSFQAKHADIRLDDNHVISMPWIAVSDGKGLYLDEMEVDFSVKVTGISQHDPHAVAELAAALQQRPDCPRLEVTIGPSAHADAERPKDVIDFKVKFKSQDAPEAVMRVIDKFNATIHPIKVTTTPDGEAQQAEQ